MKFRKAYLFFVTFFLFILIWHILILFLDINQTLFPTPEKVIASLRYNDKLALDIGISLFRLISGSSIGIFCAVAFGIITGTIAYYNNTLGQLSNFLRFIPPLALIPLFLVWFGIGEFSKVSLLAWAAFFPVWISTFNGVKSIEGRYLLVAKSLGVKRLFMLKEIILKGSLNYIINGARIGVGIAFSVLIAAEMLGSSAGMGYRIFLYQAYYRVDLMIAYIIILGTIGLVVDRLFLLLAEKLTPWKNEI